MTYSSLQGIFTTMIGFVTWPPYQRGGQVTKPIIVLKTIVYIYYVIQVKGYSISWPYLILVTYSHCGF